MENTFWIQMPDNVDIYVKKWFDHSKKPKAIVQLAHGMVEHIDRYNEFADFLVKNDIFVYGNDHRGHGKTGEKQGLFGYLADEDGFNKTTNDLLQITSVIKQEYPDTPLILLGHSMGSFLARNYILENSSLINGVILSGTGYYPRVTSQAAMQIASTLPAKEKSNMMNTLAFFSYNKRIKQKRTNIDWLTRDEEIVQAFIDDPYCGFIPTAGFFHDLMDGITTIHIQELNRYIRSDLPMLLLSGIEDPVGDYAKGVWKTANLYNETGLENVITMLYEDGRHELLNEINRDEVYQAVYRWIMQQI
ncbi:Lysophospholipase, alpha-beta hydrolase superfamily [Virgibacillus subterraneus]|uniref:Lysophospholipase, alpha-beta hydrolase superfamily n=1 Tax=Virgibacillus subterraneus TaxID=621109 RepID=A0A1H9BVY8_9BACI|nr:alpha/beta hydrolase [Virgibacillus subterraneus]SEP93044.1 Lysophospholipase, alpha-beta hydrolase superfamily [Virgibacillus subterraneus]